MPELMRKLSTRIIVGTVDKETMLNNKPVYVIGGIAKTVQSGSSNFGDWVAFKGEFYAYLVNKPDEVMYASKAFLPPAAHAMVESALQSGKGDAVQFAFAVAFKPGGNRAGYEYVITPVTKPMENDPISMMIAETRKTLQIPESKKSLPAPGKK